MMTSFTVINVNAAEEVSIDDVQISPAVYCPQHNIVEKYLTSYVSGTSTHPYQPSTSEPPVDCIVTTTTHVVSHYCTKCGTSFGNSYYTTDSHSAH